MLHLTSGSALVVEFGLAVFCFIDALITPEAAVRWIPRWGWVLFVLTFPVCGTILWITAGRSWRSRIRSIYLVPRPNPAATADPADTARRHEQIDHTPADPELAGQLRQVDVEHERTLELWEADLRRREQELRTAAGGRDAA
jgi:hypothetical protein